MRLLPRTVEIVDPSDLRYHKKIGSVADFDYSGIDTKYLVYFVDDDPKYFTCKQIAAITYTEIANAID